MHNNGMKARFEFDSVEAVDVPESVGKIFKLKNVNFTPKQGAEVVEVPGKTFFVSAGYYIWHFLFDEIAAYIYVKKHVKDLNLMWVYQPDIKSNTKEDFLNEIKTRSFHNENTTGIEVHKYFEDVMRIFGGQDYVFCPKERETNYHFEELYLVWDPHDFFVDKKYKFLQLGNHWSGVPYAWWTRYNWQEGDRFTGDIFEHQWWRRIGISEMRSIFLKELESYPEMPYKKIFISRRDADARYSKELTEEKDKLSFFRYVDPEINNMIEDYYVERGYHPVNFEGMSYLDQLNYIRSATHVAGLIGSGFTSLFVAKPGCVVTEILEKKKYNYTYKFLADIVPFRLHRIDLRLLVGTPEKFQEIFKLKNDYIDSLEESYQKYNPNN